MEIKKEYHQALYADIKAPEPLEISFQLTLTDNQSDIAVPKSEVEDIIPAPSYRPRP